MKRSNPGTTWAEGAEGELLAKEPFPLELELGSTTQGPGQLLEQLAGVQAGWAEISLGRAELG